MIRVIVESPFANPIYHEHLANIDYGRRCLHDCLVRNEAPFASHLLYTLPFVLDDNVPSERRLGIEAGYFWGLDADLHTFYTDRGWSPGMMQALERCARRGFKYEYRSLGGKPIEPDRFAYEAPIAKQSASYEGDSGDETKD